MLGRATASDTLSHYNVTTDDNGYFALENVPQGLYGIKAVIVPLFGSQPLKLVNPMESPNSEYYRMRHPEREIEYTVTTYHETRQDEYVGLEER